MICPFIMESTELKHTEDRCSRWLSPVQNIGQPWIGVIRIIVFTTKRVNGAPINRTGRHYDLSARQRAYAIIYRDYRRCRII